MRSSAAMVRRNSFSRWSKSARSPPSSRTYIRAMARSALAQTISTLARRSSKKGHACAMRRNTASPPGSLPTASSAVPTPNHPGSMSRVWVHPKTHGIADPRDRFFARCPVGRPRPEAHVGELPDGSRLDEQLEEVPTPVHERAVAGQRRRGQSVHDLPEPGFLAGLETGAPILEPM